MNLDKLKLLVEDQFPEFYREEYPQFVNFVSKYYEFLATTNYNVFSNVRDVDSTLDRFVQNLKSEFASNIPEFGKLGDREFLKFAKEFYASRGSEDSYRFLFRAMYGKEIDLFYPSTLILRASDGTWEQEVSVRVTSTDNLLALTGRTFQLEDSLGARRAVVCKKAVLVSAGVYDVFIDRLYLGPLSAGDRLTYEGLTGIVALAPAKVRVISGGAGFVAGSIFSVPGSKPLRFKITAVTDTGAIRDAVIVQPGDSVNQEQYVIIDRSTRDVVGGGLNLYPPQDYADSTYFQETGEFQYVQGSAFAPAVGQATLQIITGTRLNYPGFYSSSRGFLSDAVRLQDNNYYQAFSYVIKLDEQLSSYKSIVKRLLHPSGMALWAQYDVTSVIDASPTLRAIYDDFVVGVEDDVFADTTLEKELHKELASDQPVSDFARIAFLKALEHTAVAESTVDKSVEKSFLSEATAADSGSISVVDYGAGGELGGYALDYFAEDYAVVDPATLIELASW